MACPLSYSASRGGFPRHPKLLESSSLRSVVVLRKASMRFWDSSRLRRSRAGTVCQAAHSISASSNDRIVRCLPVLGSAYPCLLSRDQKAGGWGTDLTSLPRAPPVLEFRQVSEAFRFAREPCVWAHLSLRMQVQMSICRQMPSEQHARLCFIVLSRSFE